MATQPVFKAPAAAMPATPAAFQQVSPLTIARRVVDRMLRDEATPSEVAYLYANPILWLRALNRVAEETKTHMAKARAAREHVKPGSGEAPSEEFKQLIADGARLRVARMHFLNLVEKQIEEVKTLCGPNRIADTLMVGDVVDVLVSIATLADIDDVQAVHDKALFWAKRLKDIAAVKAGGQ
jgi:hypothetical protein